MNKQCRGCLVFKSTGEFTKAGKYLQSKCKDCLRMYSRLWRENNPERTRYIQAKSKLKITDAEYERISMIERCEICSKESKSLHIDHNHQTGKFRGALCINCNHGLGKFFDSTILLENAVHYLKKHEL